MAAHPLVDEVLKKASVAWISVDGRPATAVWCLAVDGALHVVSGPGEQAAPGLADAAAAQVTLRGDHGGAVVTWDAAVSRLSPADEEWEPVATQLAGKRLNAPGSTAALVARWAESCVVNRLVTASPSALAGAELPSGSQAAPPRESTAARPARKPFRLHRVRGRRAPH
ncbi:hypothetical protein [Catenuloplanes atrovinosus]|uniref:Uncharacterized protein n=1 Tax=Catenuloplanes atrovinosus TaxID=137266 RepID=A0AAE3YWM4_9ACTN|nr:hypothetical protein [Catenuloplanes atrovinosus]MDR7280582.1 hypothetical protein [Catenuloplanes atrovinosus]